MVYITGQYLSCFVSILLQNVSCVIKRDLYRKNPELGSIEYSPLDSQENISFFANP